MCLSWRASCGAALGVAAQARHPGGGARPAALRGGPWGAAEVRLGDDTAAIPDGDGYLLLAAEGMWPELVASEPRFAGYCAVMVNASDVYAMGGRPLAIVDALFAGSADAAAPFWRDGRRRRTLRRAHRGGPHQSAQPLSGAGGGDPGPRAPAADQLRRAARRRSGGRRRPARAHAPAPRRSGTPAPTRRRRACAPTTRCCRASPRKAWRRRPRTSAWAASRARR